VQAVGAEFRALPFYLQIIITYAIPHLGKRLKATSSKLSDAWSITASLSVFELRPVFTDNLHFLSDHPVQTEG
jgi:hypothetical protein